MSMGWRWLGSSVFALCVAIASWPAGAQEATVNRRLAQEAVRQLPRADVARPVQPSDAVRPTPPPAMSVVQVSTVPQLVGHAESRVADILGPLHLVKGNASSQESDRPAGTVLSQDPQAGTRVRYGTVIRLVVSSGPSTRTQPEQARVPDVVGNPMGAGQRMLARAHLRVGDVDRQPARSASGTILRQDPRGGSRVEPGTSVDLVVSTGPGPANPPAGDETRPPPDRPSYPPVDVTIDLGTKSTPTTRPADERPRVPNVVGKMFPSDDTTRTLASVTLHIGTVVRDYTSHEPFGTIVKQVPGAGTPLRQGAGVDLLVSGAQGPPTTVPTPPPSATPTVPSSSATKPTTSVVPNVVGLRSAVASSQLSRAKFTSSERIVSGTQPEGVVVAQRPVAGAKAGAGSTVAIDVSDGSLVVVPGVVGRSATNADALIAQAGLHGEPATRASDAAPDTVIAQDPAAGTVVERDSAVRIVVAIARRVAVPDVVGLALANAHARIDAQLKTQEARVDSLRVPVDHVVSQEPGGGTMVAAGTIVRVDVSLGPPPLPDFTGADLDRARAEARDAGVALGEPQREFDSSKSGTVLRQSVPARTRPGADTVVTLVVSRGPLWPWVVTTIVAVTVSLAAGAAAALWPPVGYRVLVKNHKVSASGDSPGIEGPDIEMRVRVEHGATKLNEDPLKEAKP